jgi:Domain of unknown function (DUF6894)
MLKFFFDLRHDHGGFEQDDVGIDLPDFETAYLEAHRAAVDLWADARRDGRRLIQVCFEIRGVPAGSFWNFRSQKLWTSRRRSLSQHRLSLGRCWMPLKPI